MIPKQRDTVDLMEECAIKQKINERGYAFIQIQLADGSWGTIGVCGSYTSAVNKSSRMQVEMTQRNHRMYHFRVR